MGKTLFQALQRSLSLVLDATSSIQTQLNNKQSLLSFIDSLVNSGGSVSLQGDSASPGNSKYYGTDSGGSKGFFTLPSGSVAWGQITGTFQIKQIYRRH